MFQLHFLKFLEAWCTAFKDKARDDTNKLLLCVPLIQRHVLRLQHVECLLNQHENMRTREVDLFYISKPKIIEALSTCLEIDYPDTMPEEDKLNLVNHSKYVKS